MRILIVEDELLNLQSLMHKINVFTGDSAELFPCDHPRAAVAAADQHDFDLALIDIQLPGMSGIELARVLKSRQEAMRIAFTTGHNDYASEAFDVGAIDYLLKPILPDRLNRLLMRVQNEKQETGKRSVQNNSNEDIGSDTMITGVRPVINLFGRFAVYAGTEPLRWKRIKSAELFAYLLVHMDRPVSKYQISEALWPELPEDKSLVNLQTAIYQLRKNLSVFDRSQIKIEYADNNYRLVAVGCEIDLLDFEQAFVIAQAAMLDQKKYMPRQIEECFAKAVRLYQEPLLERENWTWVHSFKVEIEHKYVEALRYLISDACLRGDKLSMRGYLQKLAAAYGDPDLSFEDFLQLCE